MRASLDDDGLIQIYTGYYVDFGDVQLFVGDYLLLFGEDDGIIINVSNRRFRFARDAVALADEPDDEYYSRYNYPDIVGTKHDVTFYAKSLENDMISNGRVDTTIIIGDLRIDTDCWEVTFVTYIPISLKMECCDDDVAITKGGEPWGIMSYGEGFTRHDGTNYSSSCSHAVVYLEDDIRLVFHYDEMRLYCGDVKLARLDCAGPELYLENGEEIQMKRY